MALQTALRRRGHLPAQALALSILGLASAAVKNDAPAYEIQFEASASVGPDGPWNFILLADPDNSQYIASLPSISRTSLMVNESACGTGGAACPPPKEQTWHPNDAWESTYGPDTVSFLMPASDWDSDYAALLNMTGAGGWFVDKLVLQQDSNHGDSLHLPNQGMAISKDWHINVGESHQYTRSVGLFSLNGTLDNFTYAQSRDDVVTANTALQRAYDDGNIPSLSYGLHIGSAEPNVTGSLVLGGYDKSRILSDAIVAGNDNNFRLTDIALNVTSGGSGFINSSSGSIKGLLKPPTDSDSINVHPRPGVPYIYLPNDTCGAIAEHLPVTFSEDYNLYLWNTEDSAYEKIVSSPHYLSFIFSDDTDNSAHINVPFALLNLTLDYPLASKPTQYFPCSPLEDDTPGYTLGNAFLQAAFLSQHWQMNTTILAQAPGPDYEEADIQAIPHDSDTAVLAASTAADWATTWAQTLKPLSADGDITDDTSSKTTPSNAAVAGSNDEADEDRSDNESDATALSSGAIAGIAIGAVGGIALLAALIFFFCRRQRRQRQGRPAQLGQWETNSSYPELDSSSVAPPVEVDSNQVHEIQTTQLSKPLLSKQKVHEMPGDSRFAELDSGKVDERPRFA
ncbi:hypothetical protein Q7P37_009680 [Cladosporium fusiforme]